MNRHGSTKPGKKEDLQQRKTKSKLIMGGMAAIFAVAVGYAACVGLQKWNASMCHDGLPGCNVKSTFDPNYVGESPSNNAIGTFLKRNNKVTPYTPPKL